MVDGHIRSYESYVYLYHIYIFSLGIALLWVDICPKMPQIDEIPCGTAICCVASSHLLSNCEYTRWTKIMILPYIAYVSLHFRACLACSLESFKLKAVTKRKTLNEPQVNHTTNLEPTPYQPQINQYIPIPILSQFRYMKQSATIKPPAPVTKTSKPIKPQPTT